MAYKVQKYGLQSTEAWPTKYRSMTYKAQNDGLQITQTWPTKYTTGPKIYTNMAYKVHKQGL